MSNVFRITGPAGPWKPVFAWKPVKVKGKWYWLKTVYIREKNILVLPHQGWEYGDAFDLLRTEL